MFNQKLKDEIADLEKQRLLLIEKLKDKISEISDLSDELFTYKRAFLPYSEPRSKMLYTIFVGDDKYEVIADQYHGSNMMQAEAIFFLEKERVASFSYWDKIIGIKINENIPDKD